MTKRQQEVYEFIKHYNETETAGPTLREIAEHFGLCIGAIQTHVAYLQADGKLRKKTKSARSLVAI